MEDYVIHTPTREEYDTLMQYFEGEEYIWMGGRHLTELDAFTNYGSKTCVFPTSRTKELQYSPKDYYKDESYGILTMEEFYTAQGLVLPQHLTPTPVITSWPW